MSREEACAAGRRERRRGGEAQSASCRGVRLPPLGSRALLLALKDSPQGVMGGTGVCEINAHQAASTHAADPSPPISTLRDWFERHSWETKSIVAIFYPSSQFCEINISLLSLQKQPNTAPNVFQRGVEYGKYDVFRCPRPSHSQCSLAAVLEKWRGLRFTSRWDSLLQTLAALWLWIWDILSNDF